MSVEMGIEVNFDGLVGPTHSYAGLSHGNIASVANKALVSNPKEAVLQGLQKMKDLADLGFTQGVLPPQERPDLTVLRGLGFSGTDAEVLRRAAKSAPALLAACSSASSMWTANAATVSPSLDSRDGKVHFTPANLVSKFHRAIEPATTGRILEAIFEDERYFRHHGPLPATPAFGDEGAANHTRLCSEYGNKGVQFFVFGRSAFQAGQYPEPRKFPARQTLEASEAVARLHGLEPEAVVYAQQNPEAIDEGAFHNDVVAVGNRNLLFYHEKAFADPKQTMTELKRKFAKVCQAELFTLEVRASEVSLQDAVRSYLFNSQLLSVSPDRMVLIAPEECRRTPTVASYLANLIAAGATPIREVRYLDLRQSMQNGGGPACLRLRVGLTRRELAAVKPGVLLTDVLYAKLVEWAGRHYRDRLAAADLADPSLLIEGRTALDELTGILGLGAIYRFQTQTT